MHNYDQAMQKAKQLAQSEDGRKLIEMLQQLGGADLNAAAEKAAAGDFSQAQQAISRLMENPKVRELFEKMGW